MGNQGVRLCRQTPAGVSDLAATVGFALARAVQLFAGPVCTAPLPGRLRGQVLAGWSRSAQARERAALVTRAPPTLRVAAAVKGSARARER